MAKGAVSFGYNDANRLTSVSASGQAVASYLYNHRGERVAKTVGGVTRHFHSDLQGNLIGEFVPGGVLRAYVYVGAERVALLEFGAGGPSGIFYFHNDHLGTPKALSDKNGKVKWQAAHTPFGTALVSVDKVENNLRFPGQYFDEETGLHYNYFRDYDPGTGRYIESDPIGLIGGINTYSYVGSNPVRYIDPLGLQGDAESRPDRFPGPFDVLIPGTASNDAFVESVLGIAELVSEFFCSQRNCPPCKLADGTIVEIGTIAYRYDVLSDDVVQHGIRGSHLNLFKANQNPNDCQCFWQTIGAVEPPPKPGWIPIQPFVN